MSRIEKLIKEKCPDGVEYKFLGDICIIKTGKGVTKADGSDEGEYPIISGGIEPMGKYHISNRSANTITISRVGVNAGFVNYISKDFYLNDKCFSVIPIGEFSSKIITRYLFYVLKAMEAKIVKLQSEGGVPTINTQKVSGIEVPIPPIEIQQEIVRILDKFTELEAELQDELEARKKQYEYYKMKLFAFDEDMSMVTLSAISVNLDRKRKPITGNQREPGDIPYYGASGVVDYVKDYLFNGDYLLISEDGANLTARVTPIAFSISGKTWVNNHAHILQFQTDIDRKFVEYYLNSIDLSYYITGAAQPKLNQDNLNKIPIPNPTFEEKKKIVEILDVFSEMCNDLEIGLPAEIETRHKQYEYYRDKLLTFERKVV